MRQPRRVAARPTHSPLDLGYLGHRQRTCVLGRRLGQWSTDVGVGAAGLDLETICCVMA